MIELMYNTGVGYDICDVCRGECMDAGGTYNDPSLKRVLCVIFKADCRGDAASICERHILAAFAEAKEVL